jgi:hypothetical protein
LEIQNEDELSDKEGLASPVMIKNKLIIPTEILDQDSQRQFDRMTERSHNLTMETSQNFLDINPPYQDFQMGESNNDAFEEDDDILPETGISMPMFTENDIRQDSRSQAILIEEPEPTCSIDVFNNLPEEEAADHPDIPMPSQQIETIAPQDGDDLDGLDEMTAITEVSENVSQDFLFPRQQSGFRVPGESPMTIPEGSAVSDPTENSLETTQEISEQTMIQQINDKIVEDSQAHRKNAEVAKAKRPRKMYAFWTLFN